MNSEQYLTQHRRETSDSESSHISSQDSDNPGQLKHSDSLLLLTQVVSTCTEIYLSSFPSGDEVFGMARNRGNLRDTWYHNMFCDPDFVQVVVSRGNEIHTGSAP